jgi:hypothetical protein
MYGELGEDSKGNVCGLNVIISRHLSAEIEVSHKNPYDKGLYRTRIEPSAF